MIPARPQPFHGIYTATVCPFARDGSIDEKALARHLVAAARLLDSDPETAPHPMIGGSAPGIAPITVPKEVLRFSGV